VFSWLLLPHSLVPMRVFEIATLVVVGVSLQGCEDWANWIVHGSTVLRVCQDTITEGTASLEEKAKNDLTKECNENAVERFFAGDEKCPDNWNTTGLQCIEFHFSLTTSAAALTCSVEYAEGKDLTKEVNETMLEAEVEEWYTKNAAIVEQNITANLSQAVKKCHETLSDSVALQEKYMMDKNIVEAKFYVDQEVTKKVDSIAYISAAGFGMLLAAVAGVIHRRACAACASNDANAAVQEESALLGVTGDA